MKKYTPPPEAIPYEEPKDNIEYVAPSEAIPYKEESEGKSPNKAVEALQTIGESADTMVGADLLKSLAKHTGEQALKGQTDWSSLPAESVAGLPYTQTEPVSGKEVAMAWGASDVANPEVKTNPKTGLTYTEKSTAEVLSLPIEIASGVGPFLPKYALKGAYSLAKWVAPNKVKNLTSKFTADNIRAGIADYASSKKLDELSDKELLDATVNTDIPKFQEDPRAVKKALDGDTKLNYKFHGEDVDSPLGIDFDEVKTNKGVIGNAVLEIEDTVEKVSKGLGSRFGLGNIQSGINNIFKRISEETNLLKKTKTDIVLEGAKIDLPKAPKTGTREIDFDAKPSILDSFSGKIAPLTREIDKNQHDAWFYLEDKYFKGYNAMPSKMSVSEMHKLRKSINKDLASVDFDNMKKGNVKKLATIAASEYLRDAIVKNLKGNKIAIKGKIVDAGDYYDIMQRRVHALIDLRETLKSRAFTTTAMERFLGAMRASVMAIPMQMNPAAAAYFGMGLGGANKLAGFKGFKARLGSSLINPNNASPFDLGLANKSMLGAKTMGDVLSMPDPNYIYPQQDREAMMEEMMTTPLPRDTQSMLQTPELLKNKIQLQAPEFMPAFEHVMKFQPEMADQLLSNMIQSRPDMFEQDPMGRINGIVPEQVRHQVSMELWKDKSTSSADRIRKMNELNKTGRLV